MADDERAPVPWSLFPRTGSPEPIYHLNDDIAATTNWLIEVLEFGKRNEAWKAPDGMTPEAAKYLAYALAFHQTQLDKPLTNDHLRLFAAALGIERPSTRAGLELGLPPVRDVEKFIQAADIQARNPKIGKAKLAAQVGVDQKTIANWRKMPEFERRMRVIRSIDSAPGE